MTIHARLGASSSARWMKCPGSLAFVETLPEFLRDTSSEFATEGTLAHEAAEHCLRTGEDSSDSDVQLYVDTVRSLVGPYSVLYIEEKVQIGEDLFGTADSVISNPIDGELTIVDLKFGIGKGVEVENNSQLLYYLLGAVKKLGDHFDKLTMMVVQPRCEHHAGPVRSWTIGMDELHAFEKKLMAAVEETRKPNAPLVASKDCQFCQAAATCPALKKSLIEGMANPVLAEALKAAENLGMWRAALNRVAFKSLISGHPIQNLKLVEGRSTRKWSDATGAAAELKDRPEAFTEPALKSVAQIEKILKKEAKPFLAKYSYKPRGNPTIAPSSDKRPEFSKASADFADIVFETENDEGEFE